MLGSRALISLQLLKRGGIACMTGTLSWMTIYILGKINQKGKKVEVLFSVLEELDGTELYRSGKEGVESLRVGIKGPMNMGRTVVDSKIGL